MILTIVSGHGYFIFATNLCAAMTTPRFGSLWHTFQMQGPSTSSLGILMDVKRVAPDSITVLHAGCLKMRRFSVDMAPQGRTL